MITFVLFSGNGLMRAIDVVQRWESFRLEKKGMNAAGDRVIIVDCGDESADTQAVKKSGWDIKPLKEWTFGLESHILVVPNYPVDGGILGETLFQLHHDQFPVMDVAIGIIRKDKLEVGKNVEFEVH